MKSFVPLIDMEEFSGIEFVRSKASPIAFVFVLFTRTISSSEFEAARKATADPTFPLPTIDIRKSSPF